MSDPQRADLPAIPYPGIEPFTYAERAVFFARSPESRRLIRLIALYRGVLLYAASGVGKSSLVNAGVIPRAIEDGYQPERLRVQPRPGDEILAEPIRSDARGESFLPSILCAGGKPAVLSVESFLEIVRVRAAEVRPLLIFDQFEEWATLFDREPSCRSKIVDALAALLNDPQLPVKILIVLREDYLASLQPLFERSPNLSDHYVRLRDLEGESLLRTIRGPFEDHPGVYEPEIGPDLAAGIVEQLIGRAEGGGVPLTEVQIVCRSLFEAGCIGKDPARLFEDRGVQGLLEEYLEGTLDSLGSKLRDPAVALLSRLITSAGTRNLIARDDLLDLALKDGFPWERLGEALDLLERRTRLVSRELRREVHFYQIVSEFLVPWIRKQAERLRLAREEREKHKWRRIAAGLAAIVVTVAGLAVFAYLSYREADRSYREADRQKQLRTSQLLAFESTKALSSSVSRALLLAVESVRRARLGGESPSVPTEESLRNALERAPGHALGSYGRPVFDAALSFDGRWLAGTGKGGALYLWPANAGGLARAPEELAGFEGDLEAFAVSPDASWVAAADGKKNIFLWRRTAKVARPVRLSAAEETDALLFSAGGRRLVAVDKSIVPRIWDLRTNPQTGPHGEGSSLSLDSCSPVQWSRSLGGSWIAMSCDDGTVVTWNLRDEKLRKWELRFPEVVSALAFSNDESRLAAGGQDGRVWIWDLSKGGAPVPIAERDTEEPSFLAFAPDGRRLLARGPQGFELWPLDPAEHPLIHRGMFSDGVSAAFSPDGRWLAVGNRNGSLSRVNLRQQPIEIFTILDVHEEAISSLGFGGGDLLLTRSLEGPPRLWDLDTLDISRGDEPRVSRDSRTGSQSVSEVSRDGWRLDVRRDVPVLLDPRSRNGISLRLHAGGVTAWAFSGDGRWLFTGARDGSARLWDLDRVRKLVQASQPVDPVKTATHKGAVKGATFSPNGRWLLTVGGTAVLWRLDEKTSLQELSGHPGRIAAGAISSDSRWLATADDQGTVRLWDLLQPSLRSVDLPGHGTVAVTRLWIDSATVQAVDAEGILRRWRTDFEELIDLACRTAGRNLTPVEWNQILAGEGYDGRTCPDFHIQSASR